MTVQPSPGHEAFDKFLLWLSPDRELALKKHDELMRRLSKYFVRKSCVEAEELAGETRDRVVKIMNAGGEYPNPDSLFFSVAAKVWKEYTRKPKPEPLPADDLLPMPEQETDRKERQAYCLERCLASLPETERDLITRYYQTRGPSNVEARKLWMAEWGVESTLRVKTFRIRTKLRACIDPCMDDTAK